MSIRSSVAPAFIASLVLISGHAVGGDTPPDFRWLTAASGDWTDASRWDQNAVPGFGGFVGANVFIDAPGSEYIVTVAGTPELLDVGDLTLGANARLTLLPSGPGASFRSMSLVDQAVFFSIRNVTVLEEVNVADGTLLQIANRTLSVGGQLDNSGTVRLSNGDVTAALFHNRGIVRNDSGSDVTIATPGGFVNEGRIEVEAGELLIEGDFVHRGMLETIQFGALAVRGNVTVENGATFAPGATLHLVGDQGVNRTASGPLSERVNIFGGSWTINDALQVGARLASTADTQSLTIAQDLNAHSLTIRGAEARLRGITTTATSSILAAHTVIDGPATFHADVELGGFVEFLGTYQFGGDLSFNAATVNFQQGLHVGGDLVVSTSASITTPDNRLSAGGDIVWSTPSLDLDVELIAGDEMILGVRRINVAPTARRIRIGAGTTDLNADLNIDEDVLIAGANLSIGAVGEISHRTIHGDLSTTFALSQAWDFDIEGSASRGVADSDTLTVTGDAAIYGILRVHTIGDPSNLRAGDEFTLFVADSIDAIFRIVTLPTLDDGLSFDLIIETTEVRLLVVPAPGPVSLLAFAGLATMRRRRSH
jgi:hypothetical protein